MLVSTHVIHTVELYEEMLKMLNYIYHTRHYALSYDVSSATNEFNLHLVSDASYTLWEDRKSVVATLGFLNTCLIFSHSKQLKCISTSSTDCEANSTFVADQYAHYIDTF